MPGSKHHTGQTDWSIKNAHGTQFGSFIAAGHDTSDSDADQQDAAMPGVMHRRPRPSPSLPTNASRTTTERHAMARHGNRRPYHDMPSVRLIQYTPFYGRPAGEIWRK